MATQDKMDMRSWKKVLLQWIVKCGFIERNYFNLEQSDIEQFYQKFSQLHSGAHRFESLNAFLQNFYPEFKPHLDDENALSSMDYIYIYSLLLHYSCVKQPEEYFHEICQKLGQNCQQSIASFFKRLLDAKILNKEYLREAIANVAADQIPLPSSSSEGSSNSSISSSNGTNGTDNISGANTSCNSTVSSGGVTRIEGSRSPIRTPIRKGVCTQLSPSTPKTFLLEERTRELYNLRAQLETERYEKGLLEVQIKQNEDKILKLNQDHKKLQQQIKDLKNDILTRNSEHSPSSNRDGNENQTKRRLCKEITQKEDEISKLSDLLNSMREEKVLVNEKLLYAQKQIIICMERIKELDYKVDELTAELEQKNDTIRCLQENKMDLEHFIAEMRAASHAKLDTSVDCPDISFSRGTNSSGNLSSPENLGCSVVDMQLREKQFENTQLREELSTLRMNNSRLSKLMQQRTDQLCEEFKMQCELVANSDDAKANIDLTQSFSAYVDCIDQLGKCYKNECNMTCKMRDDMETLQLRNNDLCNRVKVFEAEMEDLKQNVEHLAEHNAELERSKQEMSANITQYNCEIQTLTEQKFHLVTQLDSLASEYSSYKDNYKREIEKLEGELTTSKENNVTIYQTNVKIKQQVDALQHRNSEQENALKALSDRLAQQQIIIEDQKKGSQLVKEKHEKLLVQCEQLKRARRESDDHLETMRSQLTVKELEMGVLGTEIADVRQLNAELEQRINELINKCTLEKQTSDATINKRDEHIKQINNECMQLQSSLQEANITSARAIEELKIAKQQIKAILSRLPCDKLKMQPELEFTKELEVLAQKVKELQEYQSDATSKVKCLELRNMEINGKLLDVERLLQRTRTEHDERVQRLHNERQNISEVHSKVVHQLENELRVSMERYVAKEQELRNAIAQHNEVQKQLQATTLQLEKLECEHSRLQSSCIEHLRSLEQNIDDYATGSAMVLSTLLCEEHNETMGQLSAEHHIVQCESLLMAVKGKLDVILKKSSNALQQLMETAVKSEQQLSGVNESHERLEAELAAKETELRIALDEQLQERDEWQSKLSQLMRKLAEQSMAQEAHDLAVAEITAALENNICSDITCNGQKLLFDDKDTTNSAASLRRLRQTLNKVSNRQNTLFNENCDLTEKLRNQNTELEELQEVLTGEADALNNQLSHEISRLNNELHTLTGVNEQLSDECDALQIRTVELEKQLAETEQRRQADMKLISTEQQKYIALQKQHTQCDVQFRERQTELECAHKQLEKQQHALAQLHTTAQRLDECEKQHQDLFSQHKVVLAEVERLKRELDTVTTEYTRSIDELKECKRERQSANENISQLIQQIGSIRLEKETVMEERQLLRQQLDETGRTQTICETRIKGIIERSQSLERQLLNAENEVKLMRAQLINNEQSNERLAAENDTLRETQGKNVISLEKLTLKINDVQSNVDKLERELATKSVALEAMQNERDSIQAESQTLLERLAKVESVHKQCGTHKFALEQENAQLKSLRQKLEASEFDAKSKLSKLEKARESCDDKLRKLNAVLSNVETTNVRLNLEIGALNSQLQEVQSEVSKTRTEHEERLLQLTAEATKLREEQQQACEQLAKTSGALQIAEQKCNNLTEELQQLNTELLIIRAEKSHVEQAHQATCDKLTEHEIEHKTQANVVLSLQERVAKLEADITTKDERIVDLKQELDTLRHQYDSQIAATENRAKGNNDELDGLRTSLNVAEAMLGKEQQTTAQLRLDNQILQAKYRELKQHLQSESKASEERIKENRLELEGKLEKMKSKMKLLYTEEISKMKSKHERDTVNLKSEMDVFKAQNLKYEEHTRKLSSQIVRLNDQILEQQKQNAILSTKLKHLQEEGDCNSGNNNKRCSSLRQLNSTHISAQSQPAVNLGVVTDNLGSTNMKMEDEEGEVFNNTYLADLKLGRMPDYMNRDVCAEELQYRNSLLPPHLKSTYAAQYDHGLPEDELKDGCLNILDDSTSALLSATSTGATRKKVSGATHYKRPGPPTPSKNGGRLSFGYNGELPPREILKDTYETGNLGISSSAVKTPARFSFFTSRFSLGASGCNNAVGGIGCGGGAGSIKDEIWPRRVDESNLRRTLQRKNFQIVRLGGAICTSTPRKSKVHFDQRRLLDQLLSSSPSPSPTLAIVATEGHSDLSLIVTPVTLQARSIAPPVSPIKVTHRPSLRNSWLAAIKPSTPLVNTSPIIGSGSGSASNGRGRVHSQLRQRKRVTRPSFSVRGNIFAKYRRTNQHDVILRHLNRRKAHRRRHELFNELRMLQSPTPTLISASANGTAGRDGDSKKNNNNYVTLNYNRPRMSTTTVICNDLDIGGTNYDTFDIKPYEIDSKKSLDRRKDKTKLTFNIDAVVEADGSAYYTPMLSDDKIFMKLPTKSCSKIPYNADVINDFETQQDAGKYFEQLLTETKSSAPFDVKHIEFACNIIPSNTNSGSNSSSSSKHITPTNSTNSADALFSQSNQSVVQSFNFDGIAFNEKAQACSTTHNVSALQKSPTANSEIAGISSINSTQLSRTIYGSSIIHRRLPHVNTTTANVRKSSIYFKSTNPLCADDVILITDQTITIMDLVRMWRQMNIAARTFIIFLSMATITSSLLIAFLLREL